MFLALFGALGLTIYISRDPIEQIVRADDVDLQSQSSGLSHSLKQYYYKKGSWPWPTGTFSGSALSADNSALSLNILVSAGVLEQKFLDSASLSSLNIKLNAQGNAFEICFTPKSKEFKKISGCALDSPICLYCSK